MKDQAKGKTCRVVRTEASRLAGAPGAVILRVSPLADVPPDEKPNVTVFILDQSQASKLDEQLVGTFDLAMLRRTS